MTNVIEFPKSNRKLSNARNDFMDECLLTLSDEDYSDLMEVIVGQEEWMVEEDDELLDKLQELYDSLDEDIQTLFQQYWSL